MHFFLACLEKSCLTVFFSIFPAVELKNGLEARLGLELPSTLVFDYPTINALARFLSGRLAAVSAASNDVAGGTAADEAGYEGEEAEGGAGVAAARYAAPRRRHGSGPARVRVAVGAVATLSSGTAAVGPAQQREYVLSQVQASVVAVLGSTVEDDQPLMAAGLDSLGSGACLRRGRFQLLLALLSCEKYLTHVYFQIFQPPTSYPMDLLPPACS